MTAAQNRMRMIARNIAEEGMKRLMLSVYRLIRENGKVPVQVETAQGVVTIQPSSLPPRENMIVAVAIGSNERRERAQALTSALQVFTGSPALQQFMQPQNAYYLGTQLLESMGIYDVQNYITPLDQIPPPQPNPADQLQLQGLSEGIKKTQAETQKVLTEITEVQQRLQFEQVKTADDYTMRKEESISKQDEAADRMAIEEKKLQLEGLKLQLEKEKIDLRRQEIMIEAQLENKQGRAVGLGIN